MPLEGIVDWLGWLGVAAPIIASLIVVIDSRIRGRPRWLLWLWSRVCASYSWRRSAPWRLYLLFCRRGIADARAADQARVLGMLDTMLADVCRDAVAHTRNASLADTIPDFYSVQDMGLRLAVLVTNGYGIALQDVRQCIQDPSEFRSRSGWRLDAPALWHLRQDQEEETTDIYMQRNPSSLGPILKTPPILRNGRWHWAAPAARDVASMDIELTPEAATMLVGLRDGPTHVEMVPIFDEPARELERLGYVTRRPAGEISSIVERTESGRRLADELRGVRVDPVP